VGVEVALVLCTKLLELVLGTELLELEGILWKDIDWKSIDIEVRELSDCERLSWVDGK